MDFAVTHEVTYDFDGRATVAEVAKSLVAQDKLFSEAMRVIEAAFPNVDVEHLTVVVLEVVQESPLRHRLEGIIVAAASPGLTKDMPEDILQMLFGIDLPDSIDSWVSVLILVIGLWGAESLIKKIKRSKKDAEKKRAEEQEQAVAAERRRLTRKAAERVAISEDELNEAIAETLEKRRASVTKAGMDFLAPAKRLKARSVKLPGGTAIQSRAIEAIPSEIDIAQYQPPVETYPLEDVTVTFHAHDRDKSRHWAARISEVSPDRKPLDLAPDISPEELFTKDSIRADVLVTSVLDAEGEYVPSVYYLSKVRDDDVEMDSR